jgi:3-deoxy-D-manno-octulosonate 8-phosphate phosphatase (KDO 8-P phosphatase)
MAYVNFLEKCRSIRMVLTDVDGVLTDGGKYYGEGGDELKKFNVRDGTGSLLLKQAGVRIGAITGERTQLVHRRVRDLGFDFLYFGIEDKSLVLNRILEEEAIDSSEIAYIGDEINDLCLIGRVGFFMTVLDGNPFLRKKADCVLKLKGGEGALREAATLILQAKGCYETTLEKYLVNQREIEMQIPLIQRVLRFDREDSGKEFIQE